MKLIYLFGLIILLILSSCSLKENISSLETKKIVLESEIDLNISEPSGITYDPNTETLWLVNDPRNNKIYNIDLDGELLETLSFVGDDLEGITFDNSTKTLWVVDEANSEIINISLSGEELKRQNIPLSDYSPQSGLEGICLDNFGNFFLLKEKNPGLFIELDGNLSILDQMEISFADDYSGISYDSSTQSFWIVSDESEKLYLWNKIEGVIEEYPLSIPKVEGVVFLPESQTFYIVSDSEEKLYKFSLQNID